MCELHGSRRSLHDWRPQPCCCSEGPLLREHRRERTLAAPTSWQRRETICCSGPRHGCEGNRVKGAPCKQSLATSGGLQPWSRTHVGCEWRQVLLKTRESMRRGPSNEYCPLLPCDDRRLLLRHVARCKTQVERQFRIMHATSNTATSTQKALKAHLTNLHRIHHGITYAEKSYRRRAAAIRSRVA